MPSFEFPNPLKKGETFLIVGSVYRSCNPLVFPIANFSFISNVTTNCTHIPPDISYRIKLLQPGFPVLFFELSPIITLNATNHIYSTYMVPCSFYYFRSAHCNKTSPSVHASRTKSTEHDSFPLIVPQTPLTLGSKQPLE